MDDLTFRAAAKSDLPWVIEIMYEDPPGDMRAIEPNVLKAKALGAIIVRAGIEVELGDTLVAIADGRPVGLLEAKRPGDLPYAASMLTNLRVLMRGVPIIGLRGLLRYFRYQRARARVQIDYPLDSYYVRELDVDPAYRNRGIGARLLEHAEADARAAGAARMSLCTGVSNPAQHLYQRAGLRVVETRRHKSYEQMTGNPGRVLMTKELS
jgi:ribosomal protein S18 acetylase RimI-like enzyme